MMVSSTGLKHGLHNRLIEVKLMPWGWTTYYLRGMCGVKRIDRVRNDEVRRRCGVSRSVIYEYISLQENIIKILKFTLAASRLNSKVPFFNWAVTDYVRWSHKKKSKLNGYNMKSRL